MTSNENELLVDEESFDLKAYLFRLLSNWPWLLVSIIACVLAAFLFNRYATPLYPVKATILIEDDESMGSAVLEEFDVFRRSANIENEMGILGSYTLLGQVVDSLRFTTTYTLIGRVRDVELYGENVPIEFNYTILDEELYPSTFVIELIGDDQFELSTPDLPKETFRFNQNISLEGIQINISKTSNTVATSIEKPIEINLLDRDELLEKVKEMLKIRPINRDASIIELSMKHTTPLKAKEFINTLIGLYIKRELDEKNEAATLTIQFIDNQLEGIKDSLVLAESSLESFRSANNIIDISQEGMAVFTKLESLEKEASTVRIQLDYYSYLLEYLERQNITNVVSPSTAGIQDAVLNGLIMNLNELTNQLTQVEASASEINPQVKTLRQQVTATIGAIKENVRNLRNTTEITLSDLELRILDAERELNRLPGNERALVNIQRRFNLSENLYLYLLEKKAETGIARASNVASTKIIDAAISFEQIFPRVLLNYFVALLLGGLIPVAIMALRDFFVTSVQSIQEVERRTKAPILATIGLSTHRTELVLDQYPRSLVSETFRKMRAAIKFIKSENDISCILFTSFISGDGKSFNALNTAIMYAKAGKKTLLLGMDMRKPKLNASLGFDGSTGISQVLIKEKTVQEVTASTSIEGLDFISSGPIPPNPNELIHTGRLGDILASLKSVYDIIVIDTPPVGLVSDAMEISQWTDINIFVVRHQQTPKQGLHFLNDLRQKELLKNIGVVYNGIDFRKFSNNYGYGYGYGYGNGGYYE